MNLRKQLFTAFCLVAIAPLAVVTLYMFLSNLTLTFQLYEQNLQNSTEIQASLVEENINQLMARSSKLASLEKVRDACSSSDAFLSDTHGIANDILNFTDETLDSVSAFVLTDHAGKILYFSGSNSDKREMEGVIASTSPEPTQSVREVTFGEPTSTLLIDTPVKVGESIVGRLLVVCRTDYFLRIISSHKQVESSNAFIYCTGHEEVVASKHHLENRDLKLERESIARKEGAFRTSVDGRHVLAYYRTVSNTSWILVSTISTTQIFLRIWNYGIINAVALLLAMLAVVLLSRSQSRRMLNPLEQLLSAVEQFFVSDTAQISRPDIDPHTEIGYLAGKFFGMSKDMVLAQGKLRESNYLYAALMRATYEFRMVLDLKANTVECTDIDLSEQLKSMEGDSVSQRVLNLWQKFAVDAEAMDSQLADIAYGRLREPLEIEICYRLGEQLNELWYRVIAVPIVDADDSVCRIVLHFEDITRRKHRELGLIRTSQVDPLCGLFNRTAFPLYCTPSGLGKTDAVFFIDLDKFKQVNDLMGHAAGDEVLIATAVAIRSQFRDNDTVARFGGDEFVVFAPNMTQAQAARKAGGLVRALSFWRSSPQGVKIHVTASVGVCMTSSPMALEESVRIADEAMYRAKELGKAQYHVAIQDEFEKEAK